MSTVIGQCRGNIHRSGCFAHATLLVGDGNATGTLWFGKHGLLKSAISAGCIHYIGA
jgi:hypothetical protein